MNIFILEGNQTFRDQLMNIMICWFNKQSLPYELMLSTSNISDFLNYPFKKNSKNIYFVNVSAGQSTPYGLKIAQTIRRNDSLGHIILLDETAIYTTETYKYRISALGYIIKEEFVPEEIEGYLTYVKEVNTFMKDHSSDLLIYQQENEIQLNTSDILFFEVDTTDRDKIFVHTWESKIKISGKISIVSLKHPDFFRCHRSYVINTRNIFRLDYYGKRALFQNGKSCRVSHRNWTKLKKKLFN